MGYTAFVHTKISRIIGASGIHVGTMSFGKMEGDASDKLIAYMLQDDVAQGPYYQQEWEGMIQTTPIISGGMNALRLPAFFENLGHSNVILTAGGGSFGHKDGPKQGAMSCRQGEEAWVLWSMRRPMKKSKEHSSPSRRMPTKSTQGGKRNWVTQVNLQSRQQPLTGRKRQLHEGTLSFKRTFS